MIIEKFYLQRKLFIGIYVMVFCNTLGNSGIRCEKIDIRDRENVQEKT